MNRNTIYEETNAFIKGKWGNIMLMVVLINIIVWIIEGILPTIESVGLVDMIIALSKNETVNITQMAGKISSFKVVSSLFTSFISVLLNTSLIITMVKNSREEKTISIKDVIYNAVKYIKPVAVIAVISALIYGTLALIPLIGFILTIFIQILFSFATFILADDITENGLEALKMSLEKTKGYRADLFMVNLH